jgi:hypothetical protein
LFNPAAEVGPIHHDSPGAGVGLIQAFAMKKLVAQFLVLTLASSASLAQASGIEICKLAGTVKTSPVTRGRNVYFHLFVSGSQPFTCHGLSSSESSACAGYSNKEVEVGLAVADAPSVIIGSHVELVQVVADMLSGKQMVTKINWRPISDCK